MRCLQVLTLAVLVAFVFGAAYPGGYDEHRRDWSAPNYDSRHPDYNRQQSYQQQERPYYNDRDRPVYRRENQPAKRVPLDFGSSLEKGPILNEFNRLTDIFSDRVEQKLKVAKIVDGEKCGANRCGNNEICVNGGCLCPIPYINARQLGCVFVQIELVNGSSPFDGRVELIVNGIRGTICDDEVEFKSAKTLCQQLGFGGESAKYETAVDAGHGEGTGVIWIDEHECTGNENNIYDCAIEEDLDDVNCDHDEDISIFCSAPEPMKKTPYYGHNWY